MSMYRVVIEKAKSEAQRFIRDCDELLAELDTNLSTHRYDSEKQAWVDAEAKASPTDKSWGSRASGQLRRTSMDLTRILADLRKP